VDTVERLLQRFEELNEIGVALSIEKDIHILLEKILSAAIKISNADGGTLYLMSEDCNSLRFEIVRNKTLGITMGGTSGNPIPFPPMPLWKPDGFPNTDMVAACCAILQKTINIPDAYHNKDFDFSGPRQFDEQTGYQSQSFLTVPLKNHESEIIGVLQLINAIDTETGKISAFSYAEQRLAESLASQAAIALSNRQLISQQEALFESFIGMINFAIDDKSAHTGEHCQRVPVLTMMLAEAVAETTAGPFASFSMTNEDRYELRIAGLLHDCGKITTPMHVVDKATKLQTIFDRIELIDTRFEVLKRDAEIAMLKACLVLRHQKNISAEESLQRDFIHKVDKIEEDRRFIYRVNVGCEAMPPDDQQRVRDIGTKNQWINHLDEKADFLTSDEIENLCVRSGTLTKAERDLINNHIVVTIRMLESLPWVKHLQRVPEYAGNHHERMDGKGYPRGLTREEMSIQARIMGIADIFEALTAKDRPYKIGKTLTESLHILGNQCLKGHIDADLFDVFVRKKVYLQYAKQFLDAEQIDEVDHSKIPGYIP